MVVGLERGSITAAGWAMHLVSSHEQVKASLLQTLMSNAEPCVHDETDNHDHDTVAGER